MKRQLRRARTRRRIVEAARRVLRARGALPLEDVARAAGVTRVTVYNQFGSKRGLIEAVFRDAGDRMEVERAIAALALPEPRRALAGWIEEQCRAWDLERPILRRLVGLAALDPDAARVLADLEALRHRDARLLVARAGIAEPIEAAALLVTITSFDVWDRLLAAGLDRAAATRALHRLAAGIMPAS